MTRFVKPLAFKPLLIAALIVASSMSHSDTLKQIYQLALQNDAKLKAAEATFKANQETENLALSALLPQLNGSVGYQDNISKTDNTGSDFSNLASGVITPIDQTTRLDTQDTNYGVTLNQTLFNLSQWFTFQSGKEISKQAESQFAADQQDLIVRTVQAYLKVLEATDNLEASRAEERATQRQLEQTQQRFDVGLIAITDVYEARAVYDNAVVQRLTDEGNLGSSYEALSILTGQPQKDLWLLSKEIPINNPVPYDRNAWTEFALKYNSSLKAAIYAEEAAGYTSQSKRSGHLPTLSASANYTESNTTGSRDSGASASPFATDPNADGENHGWGLTLNIPIYSGGSVSAQSRQSYQQFMASTENRINLERTIVQSSRATFIQLTTDVQNVSARINSIISARSALDATQAGYEVGTRTIIDVLTTQKNLYNTVRQYAAARYKYLLNLLLLKQLAGTLSPDDVYRLDKFLVAPGSAMAMNYEGKGLTQITKPLDPITSKPATVKP
jgi:outer membrane protein